RKWLKKRRGNNASGIVIKKMGLKRRITPIGHNTDAKPPSLAIEPELSQEENQINKQIVVYKEKSPNKDLYAI
ncbi:hypothetical protein HAX54_028789, partial [Datura stramonium]|nr:hypothetical protein [Datura stramonium]